MQCVQVAVRVARPLVHRHARLDIAPQKVARRAHVEQRRRGEAALLRPDDTRVRPRPDDVPQWHKRAIALQRQHRASCVQAMRAEDHAVCAARRQQPHKGGNAVGKHQRGVGLFTGVGAKIDGAWRVGRQRRQVVIGVERDETARSCEAWPRPAPAALGGGLVDAEDYARQLWEVQPAVCAAKALVMRRDEAAEVAGVPCGGAVLSPEAVVQRRVTKCTRHGRARKQRTDGQMPQAGCAKVGRQLLETARRHVWQNLRKMPWCETRRKTEFCNYSCSSVGRGGRPIFRN
eukprot:6291978-Prymnesium_polylepis.1